MLSPDRITGTYASPRVSIGMPVYNGADHVAKAIQAILSQTFEDFELVISDNASSDGTDQICRRYAALDPRIRYCRNDHNLGAAANYNRVFELARAEYFKWAAHDDLYAPEYLERCVAELDSSAAGGRAVLSPLQGDRLGRAGPAGL